MKKKKITPDLPPSFSKEQSEALQKQISDLISKFVAELDFEKIIAQQIKEHKIK